MKNCPNCGQEVQDEEKFCEHCGEKLEGAETVSAEAGATGAETSTAAESSELGANADHAVSAATAATATEAAPTEPRASYTYAQTLEEAPAGKKGMKLLIPVVAVIILLCAGFFAFGKKLFSGGVALSAEQKFLHYQEKYLQDKLDAMVALGFINEDLKQSSDMTLTGEIEGSDEMNKYLKDSQIQLKYDMDAEKNSFVMNLSAKIMGTDLLEGFADYRDGKIGFAIPVADEHYYRGDLKTIMKNLTEQDIVAPDLKKSAENRKRLAEISKKYGDLLVGSMNKDNLTVEKKEFDLENLKEKYTGEVYVFKPTEEDLKNFYEKLADTVEKDSDLESLLEDVYATSTWDSALGMGDAETPKDQLSELAKEIRDNAADTAKEMADNEFQWQIAVVDGDLRQVLLSTKDDSFSLEIAKKGKEVTEQINVVSSSSENMYLKNSYSLKDKMLEGSISGGNGVLDVKALEYKIDTTKHSALMPYGTYIVEDPTGMGAKLTLTVADGEKGSSDHEIVVEGLQNYYMPFSSAKINLNTTKTGTATLPKEAEVDISNYSQEDFDKLSETIGNGLAKVAATLQGELAG